VVAVALNVAKKVILQEIVHQEADQVVEVDVMEAVIVTEDVMVDVIVIAVEIVDVIVTDEDQDQDLDHKINDIPFNCLSKIKKNKSSI
jgi:hypothetical protein